MHHQPLQTNRMAECGSEVVFELRVARAGRTGKESKPIPGGWCDYWALPDHPTLGRAQIATQRAPKP